MLSPSEMGVAAVAVQIGHTSTLFKLRRDETLQTIIENICNEGNLCFVKNRYALQFIRKQNDPFLAARFVTEENRHNIINGTELKLVYSAKELGRMIMDNLKTNGDLDWALEKLSGHIADPVFASVVQGPCYMLVNRLFSEESLPPKLLYYCLKFILGLLKLNYLNSIDETLVKLLANILCSRQDVDNNVIEKALLILECISKSQYNDLKESLDLEDLLFHLKSLASSSIQRSALALINALAAYCPSLEEKTDMLVIMNTARFRNTISTSILFPGAMLGNDMKEQLALYQSLILSLNKELFNMTDVAVNKLPDFMPMKRFSSIEIPVAKGTLDIENDIRRRSVESCSQAANNKGKLKWKESMPVLYKEKPDFLKVTNFDCSQPNIASISELVYNCLVYFHENYNKAYSFILLAEGIDNFIRICDRVANLIAKDILHIGKPPRPKSTTFFFLVFTSFLDDSTKPALIEELFSQAMLLLEQTKREMKAKTLDDYEKVIKITKQKLMQGLMKQSRTFEELQQSLKGITFSQAFKSILTETACKKNQFYETSPEVLQLRESLCEDLIKLIQLQRLKYIRKRTRFLVFQEKQSGKKKEKNYLYAHLSPSGHKIVYTSNPEIDEPDKMSCFFVKQIKSVVTHVKKTINQNGQNSEVVSTITLTLLPTTDEIKPLNFITESQEVADYWNDAISCLKGKKMKSDSLKKELKILLEMELRIRLLELDGVDIPDSPPPLPPSPPNYDFQLTDEDESEC